MSEETPEPRWQLQEKEGRGKQWNLLDSEQELDDRWQLQPDQEYVNYEGPSWRPIDDLPEERASGAGWVLPSLVLVAVLAVASYVAIQGFDSIGLSNFNLSSLFGTQDPTAVAAATATPASQGEPQVTTADPASNGDQSAAPETTATEAPPTPTETSVPPTPEPMVEKRSAYVREQYGVNARSAPNTVGDPLEVVQQGVTLPIWEEEKNAEGDWLQVSLPNNTLAWISADFVDITTESVTYDALNALRQAQGLPLVPTPTSAAPANETVAEVTATPASNSSAQTPTTSTTTAENLKVSAVISSQFGLNLRQEPNPASASITLLADSKTFPVVGRSEDGQWLQLQLADGNLGWAVSQYMNVDGDVTALPIGGIGAATPTPAPTIAVSTTVAPNATVSTGTVTTATVSTTDATTTTTTVTGTATISATSPTTGTLDATASVAFLGGSRLRELPIEDSNDITVLVFGSALKVLGRNADTTFIKVQLEDGREGWVTTNTLEISVAPDTLPVVQ